MKTIAGSSPARRRDGWRAGRRVGQLVLALGLVLHGCDRSPTPSSPRGSPVPMTAEVATHLIPLPQTDQRLCTAVVVLVDTSDSMNGAVADQQGAQRPKYLIARDALKEIVDYTDQWEKSHADRILEMGLFNFSSSASPVLPMGRFDAAKTEKALQTIPRPGGGTAIGEAVEAGFEALYQSGCVRKYLICVTDGENTAGRPPAQVSRQLHAQTQGEVEMHFIAFDTSGDKFGFLSEVNGYTTEAADGAQLRARLTDIYEKRILAEAPAEKE